ncbi:MAG: hypothetical protein GY771_02615 [bacterium]|nr:hypothetical protein [bacterium]
MRPDLEMLLLNVDFDATSDDYFEGEDYPFDDVFRSGAGSGPAPWYGFPPRVLGVDLARPYRPSLALWREGKFVEIKVIDVGNYTPKNPARAQLKLGEAFGDYCRGRGLFGSHLAIPDYSRDDNPLRSAVWATVIVEAEWAGFILGSPLPNGEYRDGAKSIAARGARRLVERSR